MQMIAFQAPVGCNVTQGLCKGLQIAGQCKKAQFKLPIEKMRLFVERPSHSLTIQAPVELECIESLLQFFLFQVLHKGDPTLARVFTCNHYLMKATFFREQARLHTHVCISSTTIHNTEIT